MSAMVDNMDQNVGKLIAKLKQMGKLDNTLIMFASDNGACTEGNENNSFNVPQSGTIGSVSYYAYPGQSWPNVCDTPYRLYKNDSYEGGTCTPFIAFWPAGIANKGIINNTAYHFIDVMPTLKDISGGTYPTTFRGSTIVPMQGKSFLPVLQNTTDVPRAEPIFFQWAAGTAIRVGKWKAVSLTAKNVPVYQLFDMEADRNETKDLKASNPDKFNELKALYDNWIATVATSIQTPVRNSLGRLYPNPTKAPVYWSHIDGLDKVVVTNLAGATIYQAVNPANDFVDMSSFSKGVYFVSLYKNNQVITSQKIMKE
ncbi:MAG: sulfatase-like hydrolase/transferase, partial [Bacteroidales bacterium]